MNRKIATVALMLMSLSGLLAVPALASAGPLSPTGSMVPAKFLTQRPATIIYTGDSTGILAGQLAVSRKGSLHWTSWGPNTAMGTGYNNENLCKPDCASGKFKSYRIRLEAWRPRTLGGKRVFTRLTFWFLSNKPAPGYNRPYYTFTNVYKNHNWGWQPVQAEFYCVKRPKGLPASAGCKNIYQLPPKS